MGWKTQAHQDLMSAHLLEITWENLAKLPAHIVPPSGLLSASRFHDRRCYIANLQGGDLMLSWAEMPHLNSALTRKGPMPRASVELLWTHTRLLNGETRPRGSLPHRMQEQLLHKLVQCCRVPGKWQGIRDKWHWQPRVFSQLAWRLLPAPLTPDFLHAATPANRLVTTNKSPTSCLSKGQSSPHHRRHIPSSRKGLGGREKRRLSVNWQ